MKRSVVAILVLAAVVVFVSPGLIGRLAGDNVDAVIEQAREDNPGVGIAVEKFDRGWFTTEGRHRVVFEGGQFRELADEYRGRTGYPAMFSVVIDTEIDHGLIPLASLSRDGGSLMPGLASSVSRFHIDPGDGNLVDIPGALYTRIALNGTSDSTLRLEATSYEFGDLVLDFGGTDLRIAMDGNGSVSTRGSVAPWSMTAVDGTIKAGPLTLDATQTRTAYGYQVGPVDASVETLSVQSPAGAIEFGPIRLHSESSLDAERLNNRGRLEMERIAVPGYGNVGAAIAFTMQGLDAAAAGTLYAALKEAQAGDDPALAYQSLWPDIEAVLRTLARAGGTFELDELTVTLPQGRVHTDLRIDVPQADGSADFSWGSVLLRSSASLNLQVPVAVFDLATQANPQASQLIAMGFLVRSGDEYRMVAEYAKGLVNVNGAPLPLPVPGL